MSKKIRRPNNSRTFIYLLPYIKYAYGHQLAEQFYKVRPYDARIVQPSLDVNDLPDVFCLFNETAEELKAAFGEHPCFTNAFDDNGVGICVFTFENQEAWKNFVQGKYSKMYPKFIKSHERYMKTEHKGIPVTTYMHSVCTKESLIRKQVAYVLGVNPNDIEELDSKPNLFDESYFNQSI